MDVVTGLDSSTTATKAVAFDYKSHEVAIGRCAINRRTTDGTWQEQNALEWWSFTRTALLFG